MHFRLLILELAAFLALAGGNEILPEKRQVKRSYVCPPNFIRLSHRCYFFSKEVDTWQNAYHKCRDLHSNLAILKNANQDKHVKRTLMKDTHAPNERWIGGIYDWKQKLWKWGASGKELTYQGFANANQEKIDLKWHCITLDPFYQYKWSSKNCLSQKHYICHTKIKIVNSKGKKRLQRQYHTNKNNRLNEIPVPNIPENYNQTMTQSLDKVFHFEINNDLNGQFASVPKSLERKKMNNNKRRRNQINYDLNTDATKIKRKRRKYKDSIDKEMGEKKKKFWWKTYREESAHPMYPRPIIEEISFSKEK